MVCNTVSAARVVELTKEASDHLIIDCRSFLVFNKGHIANALNIRCNSIMRRRSKGHFALENAITNVEKRKDFLASKLSTVVLYDDQSEPLVPEETIPLKARRTMAMVLEVLELNAPPSTTIAYLNCNYKDFATTYPDHCEGCTRMSMPSIECQPQTATATPSTLLTPIYDQGAPVEILPHLYLGSAYHASQKNQLQSIGITAILNASSTCPNEFEEEFKYKRIPVEDNSHADISAWFNSAIAFINDVKENSGKVFVHCHAGVSRSATICLAYLITCHNISLSDAFRYVKLKRSVISPNFNFMGQLLKLETDIASKKQSCPVQKGLAFDFKIPLTNDIEEMEWQDENTSTKPVFSATRSQGRCKLYQRRALTAVTPLLSVRNYKTTEKLPKLCLTAPPRPQNIPFFSDSSNKSCSQQTSFVYRHRHSRTVTLST